jgi:dolichol kinase
MPQKDLEKIKAHADEKTALLEPKVSEKEQQGFVYRACTTGYLIEDPIRIPVLLPPIIVTLGVLLSVFVVPEIIGGRLTPYTPKMALYFTGYFLVDSGLRLIFGIIKYVVLLSFCGLTHDDCILICGDQKVIPTKYLLGKSIWVYRLDSYSRKLLHVLHWAGLAWVVGVCTNTPWQRFQFSVMGATSTLMLQILFWRSTNNVLNILYWFASVRTGDGYARRMNNTYCTMCSIFGMGVVVPLSSSLLSDVYHGSTPASAAALLMLISYPCAWGDCLAEMIGVVGVLRFNVYGLGEINNKSVEGMMAMFLGSVIPSLPWGWAV